MERGSNEPNGTAGSDPAAEDGQQRVAHRNAPTDQGPPPLKLKETEQRAHVDCYLMRTKFDGGVAERRRWWCLRQRLNQEATPPPPPPQKKPVASFAVNSIQRVDMCMRERAQK